MFCVNRQIAMFAPDKATPTPYDRWEAFCEILSVLRDFVLLYSVPPAQLISQ